MEPQEYVTEILESQALKDDSSEMDVIRGHREDIADILHDKFGSGSPNIRYAGSKAKGTGILAAYDGDIAALFDHEDTSAGDTLKDIYKSVGDVLGKKYVVQPKGSALCLQSSDPAANGRPLNIDVVPGRFTDKDNGDAYLHQNNAEKDWLKTNVEKQVEHVKSSGLTDAVRLMKLWKVKHGLTDVRTFVLELLAIKALAKHKKEDLAAQLTLVWTVLRDEADTIAIEDPANPDGNDLSPIFNDAIKARLASVSGDTLQRIKSNGWESVFGPVPQKESDKQAALTAAVHTARSSGSAPRPWCSSV